MSDPEATRRDADREAAEWHVRLGERPVSASALAEFRIWRASTANAEAYQRLEGLWRTAGALAGDADVQALTRETLRRSAPSTGRARPRALWPAAALAATVGVAAVVLVVWLPSRNVYATEVGEQRLIRLADGTQVRLDTATRLQVMYAEGERRILLDSGQALFIVAHDPSRPFSVAAGPTEVTALGTTFDVRREPGGARVTLVTGSVAVTDVKDRASRRWRLSPGQQVETTGADPRPRPVDATVETSWSEGRLVFRDTPLREAVAEVNRYLPNKIVLDAGAVETVAVNGVFAAGDQEAFVAAASDLFGLTARPEPDGGVRLSVSSVGG